MLNVVVCVFLSPELCHFDVKSTVQVLAYLRILEAADKGEREKACSPSRDIRCSCRIMRACLCATRTYYCRENSNYLMILVDDLLFV